MEDQQKAIWIIDDDIEDHDLIRHVFQEMKLPFSLKLFQSGEELLQGLEDAVEAPFIIICDVNLPRIGGFALREKMLGIPNNKYHSVPFIFWSTVASEAQIRRAYEIGAHGFFKKEAQLEKWRESLKKIIEYWSLSLMPSKEDKPDSSFRLSHEANRK